MSNVPQLTEQERLILHDIMSSMAFENERIEKYKVMIDMSTGNINILTQKLGAWKHKFNKKLKKAGLDISMVDISSDTGKVVVVSNVTALKRAETANGTD